MSGNTLQDWLNIYDQSGAGRVPSSGYVSPWGGGGEDAMNQANAAGARLDFALQQQNRQQLMDMIGRFAGGGNQSFNPSALGAAPSYTPPSYRPPPPDGQYPDYGQGESIPASVIAARQGFPAQQANAGMGGSALQGPTQNLLMSIIGHYLR